MGRIYTTGTAYREVPCDAVEIHQRCTVSAKTAAQAIENLFRQSEQLLQTLGNAGIDPKTVRLGENEVEETDEDDKKMMSAVRSMTFQTAFDMVRINDLMTLVQSINSRIDFSCIHRVSNQKAIHEALLQEALADSKRRAEQIAAAVGQKITGIDRAECRDDVEDLGMDDRVTPTGAYGATRKAMLSDQLQAPTRTEHASTDIVWHTAENEYADTEKAGEICQTNS